MMRFCLATCWFFFLVSCYGLTAPEEDNKFTEPSGYRFRLDKAYAVDGDTLDGNLILPYDVVLRDQRVRLLGVDAWETNGPEKEKGVAAQKFVNGLIRKGNVWIVPNVDGQRDNFGRILGHAWVQEQPSGKWHDLAEELIENKHGIPVK